MAASSSRSSGSRRSPIRPSSPLAGESSLPAPVEQESAPRCPSAVQESALPRPSVVQESALPRPSVVQESAPPRPSVVQESAPPRPPVQNVNDTSLRAPERPMTRQFSRTSSNALSPRRLSRRSSALSQLSLTSVSESPISPVHKAKGKGKRVDLPKKSKKCRLVSDDECDAPRNAATSANKKRQVDKTSSGKRKGRK